MTDAHSTPSADRAAGLFLIVVLLLLVLPRGGISQELTELERGLVGCYSLEVGEWSFPLSDVNREKQQPPDVIELRAERGSELFERGRPLLRPKTRNSRPERAWAWWASLPGDSVRLFWSTGFAGSDARLEVVGETLSGEIEAWTDTPASRPVAQVAGQRVDCDRHLR